MKILINLINKGKKKSRLIIGDSPMEIIRALAGNPSKANIIAATQLPPRYQSTTLRQRGKSFLLIAACVISL